MRKSLFILFLLTLSISYLLKFQANASPAGPLIKHLSSLLKWTRSSPKAPQTDGSVLQYENGYLVETVVEGNDLGVVPHSIRVSQDGELFAVDAVNNNIVRITPPLSQYSRARLVAGSFQGYSGHVDGKPSDARFNHPKGVTIDDKGNVYVADTSNLAIRKIGDSGVTTIAGGKSNVAGYRDGPSEDAKFSTDFDVVYVGHTCSLLVVDRGNAALRQISLNQEDCDHQYGSISTADIIMVVGAVLVGYASGMLQQGFGSSFFSRTTMQQQSIESEIQDQPKTEKPTLIVESIKEEPDAGWPSFGRLIIDLSKLAVEALGSALLYFIPLGIKTGRPKKGLTPLKDSLVMPEDKAEPPIMQRHRTAIRVPETRHAHTPNPSDGYTQPRPAHAPNPSDGCTQPRAARSPNASDGYTQPRPAHAPNPSDGYTQPRAAHTPNASDGYTQLRPAHTPNASDGYTQPKPHRSKSASSKDPSLPSRQRSSKRQEFVEFYGSGETPPPYSQVSSKSQKERSRHRHRDRNPEVVFGAAGAEPKPVEIKPVDYSDPKFDQYNIRSKYGSSDSFRF